MVITSKRKQKEEEKCKTCRYLSHEVFSLEEMKYVNILFKKYFIRNGTYRYYHH